MTRHTVPHTVPGSVSVDVTNADTIIMPATDTVRNVETSNTRVSEADAGRDFADVADALAVRALRATAFNYCNDLFWVYVGGVLSVFVDCTGVFEDDIDDSEYVSVDTIDLLEQTYAECEERFGTFQATFAGALWCARVRGVRPQTRFYQEALAGNPVWVNLFNAAGPAPRNNTNTEPVSGV